jgi:hypothetical protein
VLLLLLFTHCAGGLEQSVGTFYFLFLPLLFFLNMFGFFSGSGVFLFDFVDLSASRLKSLSSSSSSSLLFLEGDGFVVILVGILESDVAAMRA